VAETADGEIVADDLRKIKGLGPKMLTVLHALGITTFAQIAAWTDADLDDLDTRLGAFAGRPRRDNWVEQARLLSGGDTGAYEAKFGKL
jgi:predicted flap endonuclease-1-like 5' DNA nuclease